MTLKYFLMITAIVSFSHSRSEMFFDCHSRLFFTFPADKSINQVEYNKYALDLFEDYMRYGRDGMSTMEYAWRTARGMAIQRATIANTPTSRQFLEDIKLFKTPRDTYPVVGGNFCPF